MATHKMNKPCPLLKSITHSITDLKTSSSSNSQLSPRSISSNPAGTTTWDLTRSTPSLKTPWATFSSWKEMQSFKTVTEAQWFTIEVNHTQRFKPMACQKLTLVNQHKASWTAANNYLWRSKESNPRSKIMLGLWAWSLRKDMEVPQCSLRRSHLLSLRWSHHLLPEQVASVQLITLLQTVCTTWRSVTRTKKKQILKTKSTIKWSLWSIKQMTNVPR